MLVISVTGAAIMQQLTQQSPLDKGDPNNAESLCFLKLLSRNTLLSVFLPRVCISDICQFPDPCNVHANRCTWAHGSYSAVSAALCTGEWYCSLCKCSTTLSIEPCVTVQSNVRAADKTTGLIISLIFSLIMQKFKKTTTTKQHAYN